MIYCVNLIANEFLVQGGAMLISFFVSAVFHEVLPSFIFRPEANSTAYDNSKWLALNDMWCCYLQLCIAVPCRLFKFWAFFGIMFQVMVFNMRSLVYVCIYWYNKGALVIKLVNTWLKDLYLHWSAWVLTYSGVFSDQIPLVILTNFLQNKFKNSNVCLSTQLLMSLR